MTTADFIKKTYNTNNDKWSDKYGTERWCSSVMTDKNGIVYSYGKHYPLAFRVMGNDYINEAGYSSTTSKHIGWAKRALGYDNYIGVSLNRDEVQVIASEYTSPEHKLDTIRTALEREIKELIELRDSKKRKDTAVYYSIERNLHRARTNYARTL